MQPQPIVADAVAAPAGKPAPRVIKRPAEDRLFLIDCAPLLRQHELLVAVTACDSALPVEARTRRGRYVELRVGPSAAPADGAHSGGGAITVAVRTTQGAVAVAVDVRVQV